MVIQSQSARPAGGRLLAVLLTATAMTAGGAAEARQAASEPPSLLESGVEKTAFREQRADRTNPRDATPSAQLSAEALALRDALPSGALRDAYAAIDFNALWVSTTPGGAESWERAVALLDAAPVLESHAAPGIGDEAGKLRARLEAAATGALTPSDSVKLEIAATRAYLKLADSLHGGSIDPRSLSRSMDIDRPVLDYAAALRRARATSGDANAMAGLLESFAPQNADYAQLRSMRGILLQAEANHAWGPKVDAGGKSLRPMDRGAAIGALRARLIALGDMPADAPYSLDPESGEPLYDGNLEAAVRAFQERHGLAVDGVAGANTLSELNVSALERARQIAVNMERARWLNRELGARHVRVNIADYHVDLFENGRPVFNSAVVVGKARRHQTPEFSDEMTHVVVNPHWNVPYSIATKELLPILQDDPSELFRRNMAVLTPGGGRIDPWSVDWWGLSTEFFPYRLRQRPGPGNALGDVKFIFPNHHSVYLHDTPSKSLFSKPTRAFSHGCIRVAKPYELAEVLLSKQEADPMGYFNALRQQGGETFVELQQPVPVHITYRTAWVDQDGALQIRRDVYGRDARLAKALEASGAGL